MRARLREVEGEDCPVEIAECKLQIEYTQAETAGDHHSSVYSELTDDILIQLNSQSQSRGNRNIPVQRWWQVLHELPLSMLPGVCDQPLALPVGCSAADNKLAISLSFASIVMISCGLFASWPGQSGLTAKNAVPSS